MARPEGSVAFRLTSGGVAMIDVDFAANGELDVVVIDRLADHLEFAITHADIECVVLGVTITLGDGTDADQRRSDAVTRVVQLIQDSPTPCIAVVNGECGTTGLRLLMVSDVVIATTESSFRACLDLDGECLVGPMSERVGRIRAMWMLMMGVVVRGQEAEASGLVDLCVPTEDLASEVDRHIRSIVKAVGETRSVWQAQ